MTSFESSSALQTEVAAALEVDDTVLGYVYRATRDGKSEAEMVEEQGTKYKNFVWNYRRQLRALFDGDLPTALSVARQCAGEGETTERVKRNSLTVRPVEKQSEFSSGKAAEEARAVELGTVLSSSRRQCRTPLQSRYRRVA